MIDRFNKKTRGPNNYQFELKKIGPEIALNPPKKEGRIEVKHLPEKKQHFFKFLAVCMYVCPGFRELLGSNPIGP